MGKRGNRVYHLARAALMSCLFAAALSCSKEDPGCGVAAEDLTRDRDTVSFTVRVSAGTTRATSTDAEEVISSLQIFAFEGTKLEAVGYSQGGDVVLRCYFGKSVTFVAIVNHSQLDWTSDMTIDDLKRTVVNLKEDQNWDVMFGTKNLSLAGSDNKFEMSRASQTRSRSEDVTIPVYRVAARVAILQIFNDAIGSEGGTLTIKSIYLLNVVGDAALGSAIETIDYSPTTWYNKSMNEESEESSFYSGELNFDLTLGAFYNTPHYFYCYPNPTQSDCFIIDRYGTWKERYTRLTVAAKLNGVDTFYTVTLPGVNSNHSYEITKLTVTGLGYYTPDDGPLNGDDDSNYEKFPSPDDPDTGLDPDDPDTGQVPVGPVTGVIPIAPILTGSDPVVIPFSGGEAIVRECVLDF